MKNYRFTFIVLQVLFLASCSPQGTPTVTPTTERFMFGPQTADEANEILTLAEEATLKVIASEEYIEFDSYYLSAEYAAWNALRRFPNDPHAETWKWKLAYYAALSGDKDLANNTYVELITHALSNNRVSINDLPSYFKSGEIMETLLTPHFTLAIDATAFINEANSYLVSIKSSNTQGDACYLITQNKNGVSTYLLYNHIHGGFAGARYGLRCEFVEITNDNKEEAVVRIYYSSPALGKVVTQIFDIGTLPPSLLPFRKSNGETITEMLGVSDNYPILNGKAVIETARDIYHCPVEILQTFKWDGRAFAAKDASIKTIQEVPLTRECVYRFISEAEDNFNLEQGVGILDQAIVFYKPVAVSDEERQLLDALRVHKGLLYLFADQSNQALEIFKDILRSPYQQNGIWIEPVRGFLETYQTQDDIYRACAALVPCDSYTGIAPPLGSSCVKLSICDRDALDYLIENQTSSLPLENLVEGLRNLGVNIDWEASLDLDRDGTNELIFTVVSPTLEYRDLMIASKTSAKTELFRAGEFWEEPSDTKIISLGKDYVSIQLSKQGDIWERIPLTQTSLVDSMTGELNAPWINPDPLNFLRQELQKDGNVYSVYVEFMNIKKQYDGCPYASLGGVMAHHYCAIYYYDMGFAAELVGDEKTAREMYSTLISVYSNDPLAILAKNKLGQQ